MVPCLVTLTDLTSKRVARFVMTAEFLVFTLQYWINLQLCWKFSWFVCVLHRPETFGRNHSLV